MFVPKQAEKGHIFTIYFSPRMPCYDNVPTTPYILQPHRS